MRSITIYFPFLILLSGFFLGCDQQAGEEPSKKNTLFKKIASDHSGIDFSNILYEDDSFNILSFEFYFNGSGLAVGDINNDGLSDIFFGGNMEPSKIYLNKGNLKFEDITYSAGINTENRWITGVSMVDINQDGKLDIYLCVGGNAHQNYRNLLYINTSKNNNVSFTESAVEVGLADDGYSIQSAFFDYDRDGDLDMYLLTSSMKIENKSQIRERKSDGSVINSDQFYLNEGLDPRTGLPQYIEYSSEAGIGWDGFSLGIVVCDINKDQWPDVYVANDYISNDLLYVNQRNGKFSEESQKYFKHGSFSAMGTDVADINNDGLLDIFTLDMLPEDNYRKKMMSTNIRSIDRHLLEKQAGYSLQYVRNTLQLNTGEYNGQSYFSEIGQLSGVFETDWSWVSLFADFDNDGYKDLFVGNGIVLDFTNMDFTAYWTEEIRSKGTGNKRELHKNLRNELNKKGEVKKPNVIYRNTGNLIFKNKTEDWGLDQPTFTTSGAYSDLDNDGDIDLVLNNINDKAFIYENLLVEDSITKANFLNVSLRGDTLNRGGIGAKIDVYYENQHQYHEHYPVRGYMSSVDPKIHFGLGQAKSIDSLRIVWPDSKIQKLYNVEPNQLITLDYQQADEEFDPEKEKSINKLFVSVKDEKNITFIHSEREFVEYKFQPLIPHQYSKEGPGISVGDVNGDNLDDFYVGGSLSYPGKIFLQNKNGSFDTTSLPGEQTYEDMGSLFFDADNDGDLDLYVVSGGAGLPKGSPLYQDRLYINDGNGGFTFSKTALINVNSCGSMVSAGDYDRDGDLDLFVGGRIDLEDYPLPAKSFLLRNDSENEKGLVKFTNVTQQVDPGLGKIGNVAAALWTDYNQDGWVDLLIAGEWMPIAFYKNEKGRLVNKTAETGIDKYKGWWNSITGADFDKDGDIDYVAGNLGLNNPYNVSQDHPMRLIAKDFDNNGAIDPICTYHIEGKEYPMYSREMLISQIPSLKKKFTSYHDYASSTINDIFSQQDLSGAYVLESNIHETSYIENNGDGTFSVKPLPIEAQFAPVFGILANDYNNDGHMDILMGGNSHDINAEMGQMNAFVGLLLIGDGTGNFTPQLGTDAGFFVDGDVKGMAELINADGKISVLVAQNSDSLEAFTTSHQKEIVRLQKDDAFGEVIYENGDIERREFYFGSGYLSQSSRALYVPEGVSSVKIKKFNGEERTISF